MPKLVKKLNTAGPAYLLDRFVVPGPDNAPYEYSKSAADNLKLWLRFDTNLSELVKYDTNNTPTLTYSSVDTSEVNIYNAQTKVAKTSGGYALVEFPGVSGNDNILSFGDSSSTSPNNDLPFSVGFWFKKEFADEDDHYFFTKGKLRGAGIPNFSDTEYFAYYDGSSDKIVLGLVDASIQAQSYSITTNSNVSELGYSLANNEWHYIVLTYSGLGGTSPADGVKIYVDGVIRLTNSALNLNGTYDGLEKKSNQFHVGVNATALSYSDSANARFGEMAVWSKELNNDEIIAIYRASYNQHVFKSGYLNEPPRLRLRRKDNKFSNRPTTVRTGDRNRTGGFNRKPFNDQHTLVFGKQIKEDFQSYDNGFAAFRLDKAKWKRSGLGDTSAVLIDNVLKLRGPVPSLKTAISLTNITEVKVNYIIGSCVKPTSLKIPQPGQKLQVQHSTTGDDGTWNTLAEVNLFELRTNNPNVFIVAEQKELLVTSEKLTGSLRSGFIRIGQNTAGTSAVCGILKITIKYSDQTIVPGLMANLNNESGKNLLSSSLMSPHFIDSNLLIDKSRTPRGAGNNIEFEVASEDLKPFSENHVIDNNDIFFREGLKLLDEDLKEIKIEGFSLPTRSKTKLTFDLSSHGRLGGFVGNTTRGGALSGLDNRAGGGFKTAFFDSIVLYKKSEHQWETSIGAHGRFTAFVAQTTGETMESSIANKGKLLAFGPLDAIASGSSLTGETNHNEDLIKYLPEDAIKGYVRPIRTFGFPTLGQYNHPSADCFKMKNYSSKPFLLEKCVLEFNARFEFAKRGDQGENQYGLQHYYFDSGGADDGSDQPSDRINQNQHKVIIPTFFILRQKKVPNDFTTSLSMIVDDDGNQTKVVNIYSGSTGDLRFEGNTTRELVTYGQMTLYASSSAPFSNRFDISLQEALNRGLSRDLDYDIMRGATYNPHGGDSLPSVTGSFVMSFPCRETPKIPPSQRMYISGANGLGMAANKTNIYALLLGDEIGGRGIDEISGNERSYFKGKQSQLFGAKHETFGTARVDQPIEITPTLGKTIDKPSPYLLMPDDELIFGWAYPINNDHIFNFAANGDTRRNFMILTGSSKLHMFGSLISGEKEHHETLNQPLYTDSIFETVIGNEKVIDQFQLETPAELSGSYIDNYMVAEQDVSITFSFGSFINTINVTVGQAGEELHNLPAQNRIGNFLGSLVNKRDSYAVAGVSSNFTTTRENAIGQFQKFITVRSATETPLDSNFVESLPGYGRHKSNKFARSYMNHRHYGYLSDNIEPRKTHRTSIISFIRNPFQPNTSLTVEDDLTATESINYTVKAKFIMKKIRVTPASPLGPGQLNTLQNTVLTIETLDFNELEAIRGSRGPGFLNVAQSSNTNIFMTSSFPYNDNDISKGNNDLHRNRNYPGPLPIFLLEI